QRAMSNFAAAGSTHKPNFADAERREIVVQHEALGSFGGIEHLDALFVVFRSKSRSDQRLSFSARKQGRAVRARENADFDLDLADLIELASIGTLAILQHLIAKNALHQTLEEFLGNRLLLFGKRFYRFVLRGLDAGVTFELLVLLRVH